MYGSSRNRIRARLGLRNADTTAIILLDSGVFLFPRLQARGRAFPNEVRDSKSHRDMFGGEAANEHTCGHVLMPCIP